MQQAIGIDIVKNARVRENLSQRFLELTLAPVELAEYNQRTGRKQLEFLCGRIAAKEAVIKTLNDFEKQRPDLTAIEITVGKNGAPVARFKNYDILVSIAHEEDYTVAQACLIF